MNYNRIYKEFITNRLKIQPVKPVYFEKHHIIPRSLGGNDEPKNIIRLTPEDHFFAHLLLAKIYGGKLWAPIAFMVGGNRKFYKPTSSRLSHGWAARALARSLSGELAYQFDKKIHHLINADGVTWVGLQSEIPNQLGISKSMANMVIKGRVSVAKGWSLVGEERKTNAGSKHAMYRPEIRDFCHVDGRTFTGTQIEFANVEGMHRPAVCKLVSGASKIWNGWYLKGTELPTKGRGARWLKQI
jgi:hypothetical protein